MFTNAVLPALYMLWGLATKRISDWDMTRREERAGLYFFTIFCHLFGVVFAFLLGKVLLAKILFIFWSLAVVFALITVVWKISIHAGVNAAALAFLITILVGRTIGGWRWSWWRFCGRGWRSKSTHLGAGNRRGSLGRLLGGNVAFVFGEFIG